MINYRKSNLTIIFENVCPIGQRGLRLLAMAFLVAVGLASCTKKFTTINEPWKGSPTATLPQLYAGFVSNMALSGGDQNDDNGWLYPISQQGMVYAHPDFPYASTNIWSNFYYNLANFNTYMDLIKGRSDSAELINVRAMLVVLRAYQAIKVSDYYGDMPFSAAGKAIYYGADNYKPAYDKQQSIYVSCLNDLQWAVNHFNTTDQNQYSMGSADLVLQNN